MGNVDENLNIFEFIAFLLHFIIAVLSPNFSCAVINNHRYLLPSQFFFIDFIDSGQYDGMKNKCGVLKCEDRKIKFWE